jgi:hypothetical protein
MDLSALLPSRLFPLMLLYTATGYRVFEARLQEALGRHVHDAC